MAQFRGTASAARDLLPLIAASSQEPMAHCGAFITASGLAPKGAAAHELKVLYWFIYSFVCIDRGDPYQSVAMEHVCRRIRQMTKAVRKCAKFPDYGGLHHYLEHMADAGVADPVGTLDSQIASHLRDEGFVLKQQRLAREEQEAIDKKRKNPKTRQQCRPKKQETLTTRQQSRSKTQKTLTSISKNHPSLRPGERVGL